MTQKQAKPAPQKVKIVMTDEELKDEDLPSDEQLAAEDAEDAAEEKKQRPRSYHISFRDEKNMWQVKIAKGKVLKMFKTQDEAIAFAKEKAENQDGSIVIHKKGGGFRKQTY